MEDLIKNFSKNLGLFCNHLQSSCDALKQSIDRRPIPLDSASSTFVHCLNRRVSTATSDLNLLDTMSFGTVSFEELLGHCYQIFNKNQDDLLDLEDRLKPLGYFPQVEIEDEEEEEENLDSKKTSFATTSSAMKSLEEDPLLYPLDESLSLKNFGLSDVCLATLASQANHKIDDSDLSFGENMKYNGDKPSNINGTNKPATDTFEATNEETEIDQNPTEALRPLIQVYRDAYDSLPSYMTSLASWEDLLAAVEKINSSLGKKDKTKGYNYFHQDEIESLDLGPKGRAYMLLLVRMNQLVVETVDGRISYRVL